MGKARREFSDAVDFDVSNRQLVVGHRGIVMTQLQVQPMTPQRALVHAAWLVRVASEIDPTIVGFILFGRQVRFALPLPDVEDDRFRLTPERRTSRTRDAQVKAWEAECRRAWRSLALVIKAKLAAVDDGIVEFEREFLAHLVVPGGGTVYDQIAPNLNGVLEGGRPADLLPRALTDGVR